MTSKTKKISLLTITLIFGLISVLAPFFAVKSAKANSVGDGLVPPEPLYVLGTSNAYVYSIGNLTPNSFDTAFTELSLPKFVGYEENNNTIDTNMIIRNSGDAPYTMLVSAYFRSYPRYAFYFNYRGYEGTFDAYRPLMTLKLENTFLPYGLIRTFSNVDVDSDEKVGVSVSYDIIPIDNDFNISGDYTYSQPYHFDTFFEYNYAYDLVLYNGGVQKPTEEKISSFNVLFPNIQHFFVKDLTIDFYPTTFTPSITNNRAIILEFIADSILYEDYLRASDILYSKGLPNYETNVGGLIMSPLQAFLRLEIFPNFYVWTLVSIALALAVVGFMVGVLRNG